MKSMRALACRLGRRMWRAGCAARLAASLFGVAAPAAHAEVERAMLLELSASVLKIEVTRAQGGFSLGSGVVVAADKIVTNCHVTRDATQINVLRGGVRWRVTAQLSHLERDLCLLRVAGLEARTVALGAAERLAPGQPVAALGYTGGMGMQSSSGDVLALHRFDGGRVIQSSNWFSSGASGGGLFDANLQLVGILTFRLRGGEAHYFAAPVEWLLPMLEASAESGYRPVSPEGSRELAYWQRPLADQPWFLKAALMQRDDRWPELRSLATAWARASADDAEPWYLLGVALSNLNRLPEARAALGCSMAIDPASTTARARLARVETGAGAHGGPAPAGPTATATADNAAAPGDAPAPRPALTPLPSAAAAGPPTAPCSATAPLLQNP